MSKEIIRLLNRGVGLEPVDLIRKGTAGTDLSKVHEIPTDATIEDKEFASGVLIARGVEFFIGRHSQPENLCSVEEVLLITNHLNFYKIPLSHLVCNCT